MHTPVRLHQHAGATVPNTHPPSRLGSSLLGAVCSSANDRMMLPPVVPMSDILPNTELAHGVGGGGENYGEGEEIKIVIHIVVYSTCTYVNTYIHTYVHVQVGNFL